MTSAFSWQNSVCLCAASFRIPRPNLPVTPGVSCGEGNVTPLQYSCLENPMDRGAWQAADHGVVKSRTGLSDFTFTFPFHALEKEMATHSSVLAWRIPGNGVAWWAAVYGVAQSRTRLKRFSSSSSQVFLDFLLLHSSPQVSLFLNI